MSPWRAVVLALGMVCSIGLDRPAAAQAAPVVDPRRDAKMRFGPFYVTPTFQLRDVGIDTNVFNTTQDPKSDFTGTLAPHADVWIPIARRALITTGGGVGLVYYKKYASERSIDPEALVRGDLYARSLTFFAEDRYLKSRERPNFEIDARSRRAENTTSAGVIVRLGPRFSAELAGYRRSVQYEQDDLFFGTSLRQALNRKEAGVRLTARHRLTSLTTLAVRAETQSARFDFSPDRDADRLRITPGFEFGRRALISGSAEVGYGRMVTKNPGLPGFNGVVGKAGLTYTLREATQFGVTWDRDVNYSFEVLQPYYVANVVSGRVRRHIRGRVDGIVTAQRASYAYRTFNTAPASLAGRVDVFTSYSADIGYRLNRDVRIGVAVTKVKRVSTIELLHDYHATRVGLSLVYNLPG